MAKKTSKANEAAQVVAVDVMILSQGMKKVFEGCALIFDSIGASQAADQMSGLAKSQMGAATEEKKEEDTVSSGAEAVEAVEANTEATAVEKTAEEAEPVTSLEGTAVAITIEDLQKVAAQKITVNRKNSAKIQSLVKAYGSAKLSDIPEAKREAFLNDLAQL